MTKIQSRLNMKADLSNNKRLAFSNGMRDGIPIATGYFAVSFTLGIAAKNAGFTPLLAMIVSLTNNASAGEYAGFTMISQQAGYWELALMMLITNARYFLMSCALSQKLDPKTPLRHRLLIGYDVTDEIFGICINSPGRLNPFYAYGAFSVAIPGWAIGTYLGVLMGNVLPANVVSALSVGLYGMFIAIIIPPARKNRLLAGLIIVSMILSLLFHILPFLSEIPSGTAILILTIILSAAAAILFPIKEEPENGA